MLDYQSWRCMHNDRLFCPPEGCSKSYGCARDHGWLPNQPTPPGCDSIRTIPTQERTMAEGKWMPFEPTDEMVMEGGTRLAQGGGETMCDDAYDVYRAMLAAAPASPPWDLDLRLAMDQAKCPRCDGKGCPICCDTGLLCNACGATGACAVRPCHRKGICPNYDRLAAAPASPSQEEVSAAWSPPGMLKNVRRVLSDEQLAQRLADLRPEQPSPSPDMREALEKIARQKLSEELPEDPGDFEEGYNEIVRIARAAILNRTEEEPTK